MRSPAMSAQRPLPGAKRTSTGTFPIVSSLIHPRAGISGDPARSVDRAAGRQRVGQLGDLRTLRNHRRVSSSVRQYFYDETGASSEPLFAPLMNQLDPSQSRRATKEVGLREFQRRGWLLVDATYEPVNKLDRSSAGRVIERDYPFVSRRTRNSDSGPLPTAGSN
jgi:hypothetical protein